jgi:hypothetical protein
MTAHSPDAQSQASGPDSAIEVLKKLEETTFKIVFTAFFGSTATDDHTSLEAWLQEFRDAFSISSGLSARAEIAWEKILLSHLVFGLIPVDDIRKTEQFMRGIKSFCRKQIAQRKSEVCVIWYQHNHTAICVSSMMADFVFDFSTRLRLAVYPTRTF